MMEYINIITAIIGAAELILGIILIPLFMFILNLTNGMKCQLRSEMLRIYYENKDADEIRQYELENFIMLYKAYKSLKGNSFIDKIYKEIMTWDVLS